MPDESQDWTLVGNNYSEKDGFLPFQAERAFDTGDVWNDHKLIDDSDVYVLHYRIIAAWGDSPFISHHGHKCISTKVQLSHQQNKTRLTVVTPTASSGNASK